MKANHEQIDQAIAFLRESRASIPEYDIFGDNNWETIDSQLYYLEDAKLGFLPIPDMDELDSDEYECVCWIRDTTGSDYLDKFIEANE